jgi:predicted TIM-barrel fold metal-dependent hydrolase
LTVVDVQHHLIPPSLVEAAKRRPDGMLARSLLMGGDVQTEVERRLAGMDEAGVDIATLSVPLVPDDAKDDPAAAAETIAAANDGLIATAAAHPARFNVMLSLPFPFADECLAELDRVGSEPAVVSVIMHCDLRTWLPDKPELEPVFRRAAELGLPVSLHPATNQIGPPEAFADWMMWASIGPMIETTVAASRMMLSGLLDRVPELVVVVPHLGGVLPFLVQRMVDQSATGDAEHNVLWYMQNRLIYDTCNLGDAALDATVATVGADRIMLGSDYAIRGPLTRHVAYIAESVLSDEDKHAILHGTAERYGFTRTAPPS